jgi:CDP-glycerol glycerophosphotransferase (TagB/SpsB family)
MSLDIKGAISWRVIHFKKSLITTKNRFILFLDNRVRKVDNTWAFPVCYLNGQLFDNARPIFEKLCTDSNIRKIVLYRNIKPKLKGENVKILKLSSLRGLWYLFRSKVVFVRHCVAQDIGYLINNNDRLIVNLWHGLPLKKIGVDFIPNSITGIGPLGAIICSAPTDKSTMIKSFTFAHDSNAWLTGFPRNDVILTNETDLWCQAKLQLEIIKERLFGRKLILFAPTFRAGWESMDKNAGFYKFSDTELAKLEHIAKDANAVIGIRTHLREERAVIDAFRNLEVVVLNDIIETALVLKMTDILITDYSSLAFDFLLTERPLISFAFDFDTYQNGRGFIYKLEQVFPSTICYDFQTLLVELEKFTRDNFTYKMTTEHLETFNKFHTFKDNKATDRVIEHIFENSKIDI